MGMNGTLLVSFDHPLLRNLSFFLIIKNGITYSLEGEDMTTHKPAYNALKPSTVLIPVWL